MKQSLNSVLEAINSRPGANAGAETFFKYEKDVLYPAVQSLMELRDNLPSQEEMKLLKSIFAAVLENAEKSFEVMRQVVENFSGKQQKYDCDCSTHVCADPCLLGQLRTLNKKLDILVAKEEVEGMCCATSFKA